MRLFIGIPLPKQTAKELYTKLSILNEPSLRLIKPENYHITLVFLGEMSESTVPTISNIIKKSAKERQYIPLIIKPSLLKNPTSIAFLVSYPKELVKLYEHIKTKLENNHIPFKAGKFTPHITVGKRKKHSKSNQIKKEAVEHLKNSMSFEATQIALYKSTLTQKGSRYTIITHENLKH